MSKTLFFLSSDNFHAHLYKNGVLTAAQYFAHTAQGLKDFSVFLESHHDPAYVLVDLIEEDFRHEIVPHLTGSSQNALIQRKFEQYYRNTPFRLAQLQQRQTEGRRDDEMLFSALTNPARISAWMDLLLLQKTPVVGIYSLPHTSAPLIKDIDSDHLLLLSWEKDAGLRQSYFFNKRLRFSRLTPLNTNGSFSTAIATETARTQQYLHSLSLTPPGEKLSVHIICHADDRKELKSQLQNSDKMQYDYLDIQELGHRIAARDIYPDSDATALFLSLVSRKPPRAHYANATLTHYYQLWQIRRTLFGMAALTAFICLVWGTLLLQNANSLDAESEPIKAQVIRLNHDIQQILQSFPHTAVPAADMKSAVTQLRKLHNYAPPPQEILGDLAGTLDNFPRIRTSQLSWKMGTDSAGNGAANLPAQIISYNGELADFGNDYRSQLEYLERFQQALTQSGYTVSATKMPLDVSSKGSISADVSERHDKPAEFSLQLVWRHKE